MVDVTPTQPVRSGKKSGKREANAAARADRRRHRACQPFRERRIAFAAEHIVGKPLVVEADIFADGHDLLAAEVLCVVGRRGRAPGREADAHRQRSLARDAHAGPDRAACISRSRRWRDDYGSLSHGLEVKHRAGIDVAVELTEAAAYLADLDGEPKVATLLAEAEAAPRRKPWPCWRPPPRARPSRPLPNDASGRARVRFRSMSNDLRPSSPPGTSCFRAPLRTMQRATARSTTSSEPCRACARWASTSCTSRPSIRSARPTARAATTPLRRVRTALVAPPAIGGEDGGHYRHPPSARHARGFSPPRRGCAGAGAGNRARFRHPVLA